MSTVDIPLKQLQPHPANSNVMTGELFDKLIEHIKRHDRYPPIIVRQLTDSQDYQIIDGHHRVRAVEKLGYAKARCVVWQVDDDETLVLLATLNRLQGQDDPHKRAALVARLSERLDIAKLAQLLPEQVEQLERLGRLHAPPPAPRPPQRLDDMPVPVHFFLLPAQRRQLEQKLKQLGGPREQALMTLVENSDP